MTKPMLDGRELSELDLAEIKRQIESFDTIDAVSDEMREIIAQHWPAPAGKDQTDGHAA